MDANYLLLWIVGISSLSLFVKGYRLTKKIDTGWNRVAIFLAILLVCLYQLLPNMAGYICGIAWLGLVLIPTLMLRRIYGLVLKGDLNSAISLARWLPLFHPLDGWINIAPFLQGFQLLEQGRKSEAQQLWERLAAQMPQQSKRILDTLYRCYQSSAQNILSKNELSLSTPVVVYAIVALNLIMFFLEIILGGSTSSRTLYELGGLIPILAYEDGQWWRILCSIFLHFGFAHLAANMFGLLLLGPFLERTLGKLRFMILYFLAGIGSFLVIVFLTQTGLMESKLTIGASGAIMGLVGGSAAVFLVAWLKKGKAAFLSEFKSLLFIIALQTVFDLTTPQVSFVAHFAGVLIGFIAALLLVSQMSRVGRS